MCGKRVSSLRRDLRAVCCAKERRPPARLGECLKLCLVSALVIPMILEAFGGISPHSLHFRTGLEHENGAPRSFFRITMRITTRSGSSELAAAQCGSVSI